MIRQLSILFFLLLSFQYSLCQTYQATIDTAGYKGFVTFQPLGANMTVNITMTAGENISSLTNFTIKALPAIFGGLRNATEVCRNLGSDVTLFSTALTNGVTTSIALPSLNLNDIFNRGLLITSKNGNIQTCATILPMNSSTVSTYQAKFLGPIVGELWIRAREMTPGLFILGDLSYSNPLSAPEGTTNFFLRSYSGGQIESQPFATRCNGLTMSAAITSVQVGNSVSSSGKQNAVLASSITSSNLGQYVGLVDRNGTIVACANLDTISSKTVTSDVFWDNIQGSITITQNSPFDSTTTTVDLSGITSTPAQYHVHLYPVPQRRRTTDERCSGLNVAGHFNPYGVDVNSSPASAAGTSDQYEIGDLSGKYGLLSSEAVNESYVDWNLPLFGVNSIAGRSIVIHYPNGTRWVCASIGYPNNVINAIVRFTHPAYGFMLFRQEIGKPRSDVTIFGELANLNGNASVAHNYHVHVYPVGANCASTGPHYDPAKLAVSEGYSTSCSPTNPFQCELGDLSRRHKPINIATQLTTSSKFFFTDTNMNLAGPFTVINRSIVVHVAEQGASRYACANITLVHSTVVGNTDSNWKGNDSDGTVSGFLTLRQDTEFDRVHVESTVSGLNSNARTYHIYELPIDRSSGGSAQCADPSVGSPYNPFAVVETPTPASFTYNKYRVGDLSGKYGLPTGDISLSGIRDNNLPLTTGIVSSAGRSIVISRNENLESRWKCNSIDLQSNDSTGFVVEANATFETNSIVGFVKLRQIVYEDGSASVTTILASLRNVDSSVTPNHNWHVHINPIQDQTKCADALGHFDPYAAAATPTYSEVCNRYNPLACEVGDLSRKQEQYTIDGNRRLYIDNDLPLHTDQTVLGRSIVFHVRDGGPGRLVCANIVPTSPTTKAYTIAFPKDVIFDYYRFTSAIANLLDISRLRVIVLHNVEIPFVAKDCSHVTIAIAGSASPLLIDELLMGSSKLAPYNSGSSCSNQIGTAYLGGEHSASSQTKVNLLMTLLILLATFFVQKIIS